MATFNLGNKILITNPAANVDSKYGPHTTFASASAATANLREVGLTVGIIESGSVVEYWYKSGITDNDLVKKQTSSISGSLDVNGTVSATQFTGSFIGDGSGLNNIPATSVTGLNLSQITSGSYSASISDLGLQVNNTGSFNGGLMITGSATITELPRIASTEYNQVFSNTNTVSDGNNLVIGGLYANGGAYDNYSVNVIETYSDHFDIAISAPFGTNTYSVYSAVDIFDFGIITFNFPNFNTNINKGDSWSFTSNESTYNTVFTSNGGSETNLYYNGPQFNGFYNGVTSFSVTVDYVDIVNGVVDVTINDTFNGNQLYYGVNYINIYGVDLYFTVSNTDISAGDMWSITANSAYGSSFATTAGNLFTPTFSGAFTGNPTTEYTVAVVGIDNSHIDLYIEDIPNAIAADRTIIDTSVVELSEGIYIQFPNFTSDVYLGDKWTLTPVNNIVTDKVTISTGSISATDNINTTSDVYANRYYGSGIGLTSIPQSSVNGLVSSLNGKANLVGGNTFTGNQYISSATLGVNTSPTSFAITAYNNTARVARFQSEKSPTMSDTNSAPLYFSNYLNSNANNDDLISRVFLLENFNQSIGGGRLLYNRVINIGNGTVSGSKTDNLSSIYIENWANSGIVTNEYGLHIVQMQGVNRWGIFDQTNSNWYASGKIGIGSGKTSPNAVLDVNGNAIISGSLTVTGATTLKSTTIISGSVSTTGNITAPSFIGSGASLTGIPTSAVTTLTASLNGLNAVSHSQNTDKQLKSPDGTIVVVETDNAGNFIVHRNLIQSGSTYVTNVEQVYSTKDTIILRSGSLSGLPNGQYTGIIAKKYDGTNDGWLVFDNNGIAKVGDSGSLQTLTTREDVPTDNFIQSWDAANLRLKSVDPLSLPVSNATTASINSYTSSANARFGSLESKTGSYATTGSNSFSGNQTVTGYIQYLPTNVTINNLVSASYVYTSGSDNDLHFTENRNGYTSTVKLSWLGENLYTGLLYGGLITTGSSSTFNISAGAGIIVNLNASLTKEPTPTIQYVKWNNLMDTTPAYLNTNVQTFVGISSNGTVLQQNTPWNDGQYNTSISLGTVLHQNLSTINGTLTYPNVAYGYKQRTYDFIKSFGPLKLSGYTINTSGSNGLTVGSGTAFAEGRNYQTDPNNPSYITDSGTSVSKIFRYHQSGSSFVQDTNGGLGYTTIDPANYNSNGTLTAVPGGGSNKQWSIQRVFWFPNSATKGIVVYYGNTTYTSQVEAISNIAYETFQETPNTQQNAVYLGAIVVRNDATWTDSTSYTILPGGIFRNVGGSGGGGSVPTARLIDLTDVSVSNPLNGQTLIYNNILGKWENGTIDISTKANLSGSNIFIGNQTVNGSLTLTSSSLYYQENLAVDTGGVEVIATVDTTKYSAGFFEYIIKKGINMRAGTVTAVTDGSNVEYTEYATNDLGNTSDVDLSVDYTSNQLRLIATTVSNGWTIKSLVRGI